LKKAWDVEQAQPESIAFRLGLFWLAFLQIIHLYAVMILNGLFWHMPYRNIQRINSLFLTKLERVLQIGKNSKCGDVRILRLQAFLRHAE